MADTTPNPIETLVREALTDAGLEVANVDELPDGWRYDVVQTATGRTGAMRIGHDHIGRAFVTAGPDGLRDVVAAEVTMLVARLGLPVEGAGR